MEDSKVKFASVLAFCGESGSGKSTVASLFRYCLQELGIRAEFATKYISGRKMREVEDPGVNIVDKIPEKCLKGSPRKGQEIGYDLDEIKQMLKGGIFPIVITKDINFLANLTLLLNPKSVEYTQSYKGRELPVVRTRIYDIQSNNLSLEEVVELEKKRNSGENEEEILSHIAERVTSWRSYYRDRSGSSDFIERVVNIKDLDYMKNYIMKNLIGALDNDEKTLLGYINLWNENPDFDNSGLILSSYARLINSAEYYLQKQSALLPQKS